MLWLWCLLNVHKVGLRLCLHPWKSDSRCSVCRSRLCLLRQQRTQGWIQLLWVSKTISYFDQHCIWWTPNESILLWSFQLRAPLSNLTSARTSSSLWKRSWTTAHRTTAGSNSATPWTPSGATPLQRSIPPVKFGGYTTAPCTFYYLDTHYRKIVILIITNLLLKR